MSWMYWRYICLCMSPCLHVSLSVCIVDIMYIEILVCVCVSHMHTCVFMVIFCAMWFWHNLVRLVRHVRVESGKFLYCKIHAKVWAEITCEAQGQGIPWKRSICLWWLWMPVAPTELEFAGRLCHLDRHGHNETIATLQQHSASQYLHSTRNLRMKTCSSQMFPKVAPLNNTNWAHSNIGIVLSVAI